MTKLLYQGHGSFRIEANDGKIIYVDPFAGEGYDIPADMILVTHEHGDHNRIDLVTPKDSCEIRRAENMLVNGQYKSEQIDNVYVQAVPAYNKNHNINECVGYVIKVDGIKIYAAGDTSETEYMSTNLSKEEIEYTLLPMDGYYNMDVIEAQKCAEIIGAKHNIPIHMKPGELFDINVAEKYKPSGALIIKPGEEIEL
ncbi:MBL fold metallo-hydrolase [Clostridium sp. 'White wine YQ']|uniref:MBL fold metallo-hydrolase n=1 Tax=Clostridium sp. 'White wine YQ' TaxID=3027474 RepID=UPI0023660F09|nr:MBL fold metallo-hydrolase [Clostridium sp. 'White wine YQ']MDD7793353.1 MBL fold metallo-hydrolase [Clostridium sp. 'White wine YQ']